MLETIKRVLLDFDWSDYGLDEMLEIDSEEWADDLAYQIVTMVRLQEFE